MLQIAMVMADFTGAEAEELRRALGFHRSQERMRPGASKNYALAMERKGHPSKVIDEVCARRSVHLPFTDFRNRMPSALRTWPTPRLLEGASRAGVFREPVELPADGFLFAATLVRDGQRHGVKFRPVCVAQSNWECRIEHRPFGAARFVPREDVKPQRGETVVAGAGNATVCFNGRLQAARAVEQG